MRPASEEAIAAQWQRSKAIIADAERLVDAGESIGTILVGHPQPAVSCWNGGNAGPSWANLSEGSVARDEVRLRAVKLLHTVAWAFFASCVVLIPFAAAQRRLALASMLIGAVALESLVLVGNSWRCPLTDVAARYTDDRRPNFDIYLPSWLAKYNKEIFGTLYVVGIAWTLLAWLGARAT